MLDYIYIFIAFLSSMLVAMVLFPWVLRQAYLRNFNKQITGGDENTNRVLRLGGSVLLPCVFIGVTSSMIIMSEGGDMSQSIKTTTLILGTGVMLVYLIGLFDDLFGISKKYRFAIQILSAATLPLCDLYLNNLYGFCGIEFLPIYLSVLLTILVVVLVVNAVNIIDGIDGLLSIFAMLCLTCFGVCFANSGNQIYCIITASMIGAIIVFFCYNMFGTLERKTKTYIGDSGSMMIGFSLAYLALKFVIAEDKSTFDALERMLICFSLLFVPCIDLVRVFFERILQADMPFSSDQRHLHHLFIKTGIFERMTLLAMMSLILLFLLANLAFSLMGISLTWIAIIDISCYTLLIGVLKHRVRIFSNKMAQLDNIQERFRQNALSAKKICILTPRFPLPENGGDVLRINNIARQLKREGYQLVLVSFEDDGAPQIYEAERIYDKVYSVHRSKTYSLWQSLIHLLSGRALQCGYYYSGKYKRMLKHVIKTEKPDLYIAHLLRMMPYLDELGLQDRSIIEMTDALSKTYSLSSESKGGGVLKYIYTIERHLIRRAEQYSMLYFPVNVLVSQADIDYLGTLSPHVSGLRLRTNGVDMIEKPSHKYNPNKIVFVGNMRTLQNQDAVLFFVREVFPRILNKQPNAVFYIVGAQPPQKILELACQNIIVTGFVDNLNATISDAAVAVAPVRVAAGIQNKVLVAMGCGIPVVLTTLISRAIPELKDEYNCIIRDEVATIAEACLRLMNNLEYRTALAQAGYNMVHNHYGWAEKLRGYVVEN